MSQNLDLRITKTDKMIKDAFIELADTIGFEKITVMNLTKKAMISRTTFYSHYKDKYDLLEQIENEILDGMKNEVLDGIKNITTEYYSIDNNFSFILKIYKYVEKNKQIFKLLYCNNIDESFYFKFYGTLKTLYNNNIDTSMIEIPENYAINLIISVHTSIISEWIKSGMKERPEELISMFLNTIKYFFKKGLLHE